MHENTELRHKVVYLGSRCEQLEVELAQTKDYLKSEIQKEKNQTQKNQETVQTQQESLKEFEKRVASLDLGSFFQCSYLPMTMLPRAHGSKGASR